MALPPVPYQTDFQDKKLGHITQPWLQWLEQLRNVLNRLAEGSGTTDHGKLTNVTANQHHAELLTASQVVKLTDYGLPSAAGSASTVSRSDHSHGSVPPIDPIWTKRHLWWAWPSGNKQPVSLIANDGAVITATTSGSTDISTADEDISQAASSTNGARAGFTSGGVSIFDGANGSEQPFNYGFYLFVRLKLTSVTNARFRVVLGNQNPTNNDNPWGSSVTHGGLAFNFLPSVSANWRAVGKLAGTAALGFNRDLPVPVVADQIYNLEIAVKGQNAARTASFWINGVNYHTETGNTTYSAATSTPSLWAVDLYPTEAVKKQVGIFRVVWGTQATVVVPDPRGYRHWVGQAS